MLKGLHHIGIASKSIEKDVQFFSCFGYSPLGGIREEPQTGIRVCFLKNMRGGVSPDLELVANLSADGPITAHLQARRKIYHFAYVSDDIVNDAERLIAENKGMYLVPMTHLDDKNCDIVNWCYLAFRNSMIIELVELKKENDTI